MADTQKQTILIIDDETDVHYSFRRLLQSEPLEVMSAESGDEGLKIARKVDPDLIVMDIRMGKHSGLDTLRDLRRYNPRQLVIMMTAYGTSQTAIEAMKHGAYDYVLKPFDIPKLKSLLMEALKAAAASKEKSTVAGFDPEALRQSIVGGSPAMQQVYKLIGQVAPTSATILISGESGTGKELVARAIYQNSTRAKKEFIAINCAAIPEQLLESELFGHEKGSFTGAVSQRIGKFEMCDGGTLFLDEIGDMPLTTQTKILRVLQEGEISRVGSNESIKTDVRIIAATNKDLWDAVGRKEFREDLYYRLNVVRVDLPPLRQRADDIALLATFFLNRFRQKQPSGPTAISEEAMEALRAHRWPGNVREMENCIQRAMVLATGDTITPHNLPEEISGARGGEQIAREAIDDGDSDMDEADGSPGEMSGEAVERALDVLFAHAKNDTDLQLLPAAERELIVRALAETNGNQVQAAKLLGITRATLRKRVEKFGIQKKLAVE